MADSLIRITTLADTYDPDDEVLSLREALECAVACVLNEPEAAEPIVITFDENLFSANCAVAELQSALTLPAGALGDRSLLITAPEGKSVTIQIPQGAAAWCDTNDNTVELENVSVAPAVTSFASLPLMTASANVAHIYVDPDYAEEELDDVHFRTIDAAVTAHPDYTGAITVEKPDAVTAIGALTCHGKIFGGALISGGTTTTGSSLEVAVGAGQSAAYRFLAGGSEVCASAGSFAVIRGNSFLTIGGEGEIVTDFAFGGIYLSSGSASIYGTSTLAISSGTFNSVVCGGHIAGGSQTLILTQSTSCCTLTISGGLFLKEVAAGNYNQAGTISESHGTHNLMITGGTFCKSVYGGNIARTQALASAPYYESPIDMTVNSSVNMTVDASSGSIAFLSNLVLGSRYQGKIQGTTQMSFSGFAENLSFSGQSIVIGDSESASDSDPRINGVQSLTFNSFRSVNGGAGTFAPLDLFGFDQMAFAGNSHVAFTGAGRAGNGFDLSTVQYWNFEYGSCLDWTSGTNDFYADSLALTLNGQTVDEPWTFFTGSDATLTWWNKMGLNDTYPVTIDGVKASWDKTNQWYATSEYKIYREGNSLKLATLA